MELFFDERWVFCLFSCFVFVLFCFPAVLKETPWPSFASLAKFYTQGKANKCKICVKTERKPPHKLAQAKTKHVFQEDIC